jgi:hypothetical protein
VNIIAVRVYDGEGLLVGTWADPDLNGIYTFTDGPSNATVTVNFSPSGPGNHTVTVSGFKSKYKIEFDTQGGHDVALIEHTSGKWDIGGFNLNVAQPTPDQVLDFSVKITDHDNDSRGGSFVPFSNFRVGIDGTGTFDDGVVDGVPVP